jgi:hypothetical protein
MSEPAIEFRAEPALPIIAEQSVAAVSSALRVAPDRHWLATLLFTPFQDVDERVRIKRKH